MKNLKPMSAVPGTVQLPKQDFQPFNTVVQLEFFQNLLRSQPPGKESPNNSSISRLRFIRNPRAKRYILRLDRDGAGRVTIPRSGSRAEADAFVRRNLKWLENQRLRRTTESSNRVEWVAGGQILLHGQCETIRTELMEEGLHVRIGAESLVVARGEHALERLEFIDLRAPIEQHLWKRGGEYLTARVWELAAAHGFKVSRVTIRNQRSRWGSCSRKGTISLNWRLIHTPPQVQDYIILHELAHLKEMNHSSRFWKEVEKLCPAFTSAETWLKANAGLIDH